MGIKRYTADKDTTITNAFKPNLSTRGTGSNMGASDIMEVFSIYGQTILSGTTTGVAQTQELSRALVQFPITSIVTDRTNGDIPASGSVDFYLRVFNAKQSQTTPKNAKYVIVPVSASWEEGYGMDMDDYTDLTKDNFGANWINRSGSTAWTTMGGTYLSASEKTQTLVNGTEDIELDISDIVEKWITGWPAGGYNNYGLGIHLTASQEAYFSSSAGANSGSSIQNPSGSTRSFYTKKFFAHTSQFFFKRPTLEARWDTTKKDDRGKTFYSSSLLAAGDNLSTLYLYNYVNGQLKNIPVITSPSDSIFVELYSGSAANTVPSGSALDLVSTTTYVGSTAPTVVTGGYVSTGIYSASFALTAAATPLTTAYDVWSLDDGSGASEGQPGTQVHTGSFSPTVFKSSQSAVESNYVFNVTNLKDSYLSNETTRFKVFIRQKDWNPSIYTVANADPQNFVLDDVYFRVMRVVDGLEAVAFGTGSNTSPQSVGSAGSYTRLSYDVSGSYFNLDMSLLEPGYSYEMQFVYFNNNNYTNVKDTFKFRVEEDLDG